MASRSQRETASLGGVMRAAAAELDRPSALLLLQAACLPVVYVCWGMPTFFVETFGGTHPLSAVYAETYRFCSVFFLFFVVPAALHRLVAGRPLAELGLRLGRFARDTGLSLGALALVTPLLWINAASPAFVAEYPLAKEAASAPWLFVAYQAAYGLYYWGWEFFFRGALQLGLRPRLGLSGAMMVQLLPSVLLHIGKPVGEIWGAVVVAPLFGAVAVQTRSVLPLFVFHYGIGVINDVFCALRGGLW